VGEVKAEERAAKGHASALDGVAIGLPALTRAEKIQKRAARVGFDWPDVSGPRAKIYEELAEAEAAETSDERAAEIGDLLFAVTNYARHHQVDPEQALRTATARFEQRFRLVEEAAVRPLDAMTIEQLEELWRQVKQQLARAE
jgi:ATP diphosphatase